MALIKCNECGSQVSSGAKMCPSCGARIKKRMGVLGWVGVFVAVSAVYHVLDAAGSGTTSGERAPKDPKKDAIAGIKIQDLRWRKIAFGSAMEIDATVQNDSQYAVKDLEITCEHASNSGTLIDKNKKVVFELIPATTAINLKKFNMGFMHSQATSTSCAVTDLIVLAQPPA